MVFSSYIRSEEPFNILVLKSLMKHFYDPETFRSFELFASQSTPCEHEWRKSLEVARLVLISEHNCEEMELFWSETEPNCENTDTRRETFFFSDKNQLFTLQVASCTVRGSAPERVYE